MSTAEITVPAPLARFSLRVDPADANVVAAALAVPLPLVIGTRTEAGGRALLALGPDEWLLTAPEADAEAIGAAAAGLAVPHSLVGICGRDMVLHLAGPGAATLLAMAMPRNLATIPVGEGARTVFDGVSVVITREAEDAFTLSAWRSYMPHLSAVLAAGQRELAAGI
ncbi:sarcosine oxidase subunit gamma family protein [Acuticoccus mangrovi]|uniref:Sarcosine oxidase subunit gamma n=1 Tax=Acuticoccus mangrovi TaxID=2796142 RepID=A0A934IF44_9HYPH|nr:sarcosine oxidase subunit gamma family protein [Acuticoccus mangrovi]MBJ3775474.1 sarcosine oxidase subunit gamma [Acuticoccus mangrovi]